jgi:hypothetical protein
MARPARRSREVPSPPTTSSAVARSGVLVGLLLAACVGALPGGAGAEIMKNEEATDQGAGRRAVARRVRPAPDHDESP